MDNKHMIVHKSLLMLTCFHYCFITPAPYRHTLLFVSPEEKKLNKDAAGSFVEARLDQMIDQRGNNRVEARLESKSYLT